MMRIEGEVGPPYNLANGTDGSAASGKTPNGSIAKLIAVWRIVEIL